MSDVMTREQRVACMRRIQARHTGPEQKVEALLERWGFPYQTHVPHLPGRPDIVFPERSLILFVHGCFWHRHSCHEGQPWPKQNEGFWRRKLSGNQARDLRLQSKLRLLGWKVGVIWECQTKKPELLEPRLLSLLLHSS